MAAAAGGGAEMVGLEWDDNKLVKSSPVDVAVVVVASEDNGPAAAPAVAALRFTRRPAMIS